jgi:type IV secretion system protein VirD4
MRNDHFMRGMQGFMALHQRNFEADQASLARRRALEMERAMREARPSGMLGDGRLADFGDIKASNLLDPAGLFFGAAEGRLLFFNGREPLLTYLRTGGGKGRDLILPNLAHLRGRSVIVTDVKDGENAFASAEHRAARLGMPVAFLNPYGVGGFPDTPINPFQSLIDIVGRGETIDTEASELTQILLPRSFKRGAEAWVRDGGGRIITTRLEYAAHFEPDVCRPSGLWWFINASDNDVLTSLAMMATCGIESIERKAAAIAGTLRSAPKQWEAYKSEVIEALEPFEPGKSLDRSTSSHEFDFSSLKREPKTVYLILPSEKIDVAAKWVSLVIHHAIEAIAKEAGPVPTTLILDEFPQLPPSPAIQKALRLYREKGVQLWFFSQGRYSLSDRWSPEAIKEFEDMAGVMTFKNVTEPDILRDLELWSGNRTVLMRGVGHNGGTVETASSNLGETRRSVLQSEDIFSMGRGRQLVRVHDMPRLLACDTVPWFTVTPWKDQLRDVRTLHRGVAP